MRRIERIPEILKEIETVWKEYPDLRLGQLLLNVANDPLLYNIEDEELVKRVKAFYKR